MSYEPFTMSQKTQWQIQSELCRCGCYQTIGHPYWIKGVKIYPEYKRGHNSRIDPPMLGKDRPDVTVRLSKSQFGPDNPMWKADNVTYKPLHNWIRNHLPKTLGCKCERCNEKLAYDVACITGIYNREFENWQWLCRKCHKFIDNQKRDSKTGRFIK